MVPNIQTAKLVEVDPTKKYLIVLTLENGYRLTVEDEEKVKADLKQVMSDLGVQEENYRAIWMTGFRLNLEG